MLVHYVWWCSEPPTTLMLIRPCITAGHQRFNVCAANNEGKRLIASCDLMIDLITIDNSEQMLIFAIYIYIFAKTAPHPISSLASTNFHHEDFTTRSWMFPNLNRAKSILTSLTNPTHGNTEMNLNKSPIGGNSVYWWNLRVGPTYRSHRKSVRHNHVKR